MELCNVSVPFASGVERHVEVLERDFASARFSHPRYRCHASMPDLLPCRVDLGNPMCSLSPQKWRGVRGGFHAECGNGGSRRWWGGEECNCGRRARSPWAGCFATPEPAMVSCDGGTGLWPARGAQIVAAVWLLRCRTDFAPSPLLDDLLRGGFVCSCREHFLARACSFADEGFWGGCLVAPVSSIDYGPWFGDATDFLAFDLEATRVGLRFTCRARGFDSAMGCLRMPDPPGSTGSVDVADGLFSLPDGCPSQGIRGVISPCSCLPGRATLSAFFSLDHRPPASLVLILMKFFARNSPANTAKIRVAAARLFVVG